MVNIQTNVTAATLQFGEIRFNGPGDLEEMRSGSPTVHSGAGLLTWARCCSNSAARRACGGRSRRPGVRTRPGHKVGRKVASAAGLAESPLIVSPIVSYRLLTQCEFKAPVCATQQTCITAMLQPLLQSAVMSLMRHTTCTGSKEPQASNELEASYELAGWPFRIRWIPIRTQDRPVTTPGA